jgi:hypothetical protein
MEGEGRPMPSCGFAQGALIVAAIVGTAIGVIIGHRDQGWGIALGLVAGVFFLGLLYWMFGWQLKLVSSTPPIPTIRPPLFTTPTTIPPMSADDVGRSLLATYWSACGLPWTLVSLALGGGIGFLVGYSLAADRTG